MIKWGLNDTIAAISTGLGEAGIGIVRLSGKDALSIADKVFVSKDKTRPSGFKTYTVHYGWITDVKAEIVDEVILTVMRSPKSYTREDTVEISCHGGAVALRRILDLVLENGARMAEPGEFTKRAFLNGRIDLSQAEAVLDIIRAKTDSALKISVQQLRGVLSNEINKIGKTLLGILSVLEADIDFPDEGIGAVNLKEISGKLNNINNALKDILDASGRGRILREGISAVICGKPNVGKSSLLNALLREERSIVTPVAGTTRDTIEEVIDIKGIPVRIIDTAGIIEPRDLIEKKAIQRTKRHIAAADLVILLFDGSKKLAEADKILISKLKKKPVLAIINKIDLKQNIQRHKIRKNFDCLIDISAKKNKNIKLIEDAVAALVYNGKVNAGQTILASNLRHIETLRSAQKLVAQAVDSLDNKLSAEFIAEGVKGALGFLDEISGRSFCEELLDKIFSEFCIGK